MAAALHVMDRDLAPQIMETLGAALSDSLEEAPKSGQRLLNLVKRHYDGDAAAPGRAPGGTLPEGGANAQSDEMRHLVGVLLRADATHERVAVGMSLSTPDAQRSSGRGGGGGATAPRVAVGEMVGEARASGAGKSPTGQPSTGSASIDTVASVAVTDAQKRARSAGGRRTLAAAHERFEAIAGSPPMRCGKCAASWLLPHADVVLVARLHRSMRAVARWCVEHIPIHSLNAFVLIRSFIPIQCIPMHSCSFQSNAFRLIHSYCRCVELEAELDALHDSKTPSGGAAATTAATLQSIAAEEQAGTGLSSWMVPRAGTFHFARSRALDFLSGADAATLFSEDSDELVPLWLDASAFCGVYEACRATVDSEGHRGGASSADAARGAERREPAELKSELLTSLANDGLLALSKVARLPKRALRGSDAARKSIARTRRALLAVASECRNVALQCVVELRAQICFRCVFNVQHIFVAIAVEQQELMLTSSGAAAESGASARRRRSRLAPRDAHRSGRESGAASQASSVRSSFLLFAHLFFCLLIYSFLAHLLLPGAGRALCCEHGERALRVARVGVQRRRRCCRAAV